MKIPLSWLKDYISLPCNAAEIGQKLTAAGIELEAIHSKPLPFDGVVVGKVEEVHKHPNAEKLCLATVTDGKEYVRVVCGAPNCRRGMKTAFARVGATLTNEKGKPFKIKKSRLRGEESCGMLCSPAELGLSDESATIIEFPEDYPEGKNLADLYDEAVLDLFLTPNLNYCASMVGIARELSALTGGLLRYPRTGVQESVEPIADKVRIDVEARQDAPIYMARLIQGVKVGPSPAWLTKRLDACGIRCVNNVVDITNYVLLELGHPLHAFDYDKIQQGHITVRRAREGEVLATLDDIPRLLTPGDLIIADAARPLALAGVMGGSYSEVAGSTVNVLLESAYFYPSLIRKTSKRFNLQTEASRRFERGADPHQCLNSLDRAASLIQELCGGAICKGAVDVRHGAFPALKIPCSAQAINRLLGTHLSRGEIETILERLQFRLLPPEGDNLLVEVPSFRVDVEGIADLAAEVARVYGYNHIPKPQLRYSGSVLPHAPAFSFERRVRAKLLQEGLQEFLTNDLLSPQSIELLGGMPLPGDSVISLLNPNSKDYSVLRPSLLPGLLQVARTNWDQKYGSLSGFEIGKVHFKTGEQYAEQMAAAILLMGNGRPVHWDRKAEGVDFYDVKGFVENLLASLAITKVHFQRTTVASFHPGRQAAILAGANVVGTMGEVHPLILRQLGIDERVYYAEVSLEDLFQARKADPFMRDLPRYPSSERDWMLTLSDETPIEEILSAILSVRSYLLEKVSLIDIWRGEKLGPGRKNATFHFVYRDPNRTLSKEEIETEHARITQGVLEKLTRNGKVILSTPDQP